MKTPQEPKQHHQRPSCQVSDLLDPRQCHAPKQLDQRRPIQVSSGLVLKDGNVLEQLQEAEELLQLLTCALLLWEELCYS